MQRTNIYLSEEQIDELDRLAAASHTSRATIVRQLIDRGLDRRGQRLDDDLAGLRESFGAFDEPVDVDRGPDERRRHLDRLLDG